ncbi:MAG: alpha-L-rhamnosidase C-terminal domain-containing protein [Planctomycetota bacterium]
MPLLPGHEVEEWRAEWAWTRRRGGPRLEVRRFRRTFELSDLPDEFLVAVSADSRYRLYCNGLLVGRGPLKGTLQHYHYAAYDLADCLRSGQNVLAAEVHWFGEDAPSSEVHGERPGFLLQGPPGAGVDTPGRWRTEVDEAVEPDTTSYIANASKFLGYMERVDARRLPRGWRKPDFDDSGWEPAVSTGAADVPRNWGEFPRQELFPRPLPLLEEEPRRFRRTVRDHEVLEHCFGNPPVGWELEAGEAGGLILDAGALTTGYPVLTFSGGAGRRVRVTYSECLYRREERNGEATYVKQVRDDVSAGVVHGYRDSVVLPGGEFTYEPFHWRTFWFVEVSVSEGEEPFRLEDATYRFTSFPQRLDAEFESSDPDTDRMMELSWRTLRLCSHETYEDCPYYEQLQYVGDTRLEALCSMSLAGETRLARRAVRLYHDSIVPKGLTLGRCPTCRPQLIPYFSLLWVLMVEDYWLWVGPRERDFVRSVLGGVDRVLRYFRDRLRGDGFVGPLERWNMVDRASDWVRGEPPAVVHGGSTYMTGLLVRALDAAVRLHQQAGEPVDAEPWQELRDRLRPAMQKAWSETEGLFLEAPDRPEDTLSQHSQVMAILSGAASDEQTARILERLTNDVDLHRTKLMQSFYLARALEKAGAYGRVDGHVLEPWREMLQMHLTTWCEYWPGRSDCHAWSSWIAHDFLTAVLGIKPALPGFEEVLIRPQTGGRQWARGTMPTPVGAVDVSWEKDPETGALALEADTPVGVPVEVELPGMGRERFAAGGRITLAKPR